MKNGHTFDPRYHRLACATVAQALRDWQRGDPGALAWLWTDGAAWLELLEQPRPRPWLAWLLTGCAGKDTTARRVSVRMICEVMP